MMQRARLSSSSEHGAATHQPEGDGADMSERVDLERACARKLRELRKRRGLTLDEVESISGGAIKAVVLGSYERETRAISLARLQQLSEIYGVDISYFIGGGKLELAHSNSRLIFDLRRIRKRTSLQPSSITQFLTSIIRVRGDWQGEVLSVRSTDLDLLAFLEGASSADFQERLRSAGVLLHRD